MLVAFNKPYDVLSQFTREHPSHRTLSEFGFASSFYPIGRLDRDSEGLLLLSNSGRWTDRLLNPRYAHPRTYHAQLEGDVTDEALDKLQRGGITIKGHTTLPCQAVRLSPAPAHPPRTPPIRTRLTIPTTWVELTLTEGKNRQVRHMTAAVGHPTLRLIRVSIGGLLLADMNLDAGQWRELSAQEIKALGLS